jgi:hypothetical protein
MRHLAVFSMQRSVEQLVGELVTRGLATSGALSGCIEAEIVETEAQCQVALPQSYKHFLAACGRGAGEFLAGTDWTYPAILTLQSTARRLVNRSGFTLPSAAFVIAMHQGYEFLFLDCALADSPVWYFGDGSQQPTVVFATFEAWLAQCIDDEATTQGLLRDL